MFKNHVVTTYEQTLLNHKTPTQPVRRTYGVILGIKRDYFTKKQIPVAARSKAWGCGRPLVGTAGSNTVGGIDVCLF